MSSPSVVQRLKELPDSPGVYLFQNARGKVLYVGKAISLRKRVLTYFQSSRPLTKKTMNLVDQTKKIDWINTASEAEALLVEASLIKSKQPKYNVMLRDDKSYPYLRVTVEQAFPRLFVGRGPHEPGTRSIGPFVNASLLKIAFRAIRQVIPFRTCRTLPKRACLDYYIGLCSAPCEGKISQEDYREQVAQVLRLIEGKKGEVIKELQKKMRSASDAQRYEEAAKLRDQVEGLMQLATRPRRYIASQAVGDLASVLKFKKLPRRIEGFDVSNIYGRQAVGAMVSFVDGKPNKSSYQRFQAICQSTCASLRAQLYR